MGERRGGRLILSTRARRPRAARARCGGARVRGRNTAGRTLGGRDARGVGGGREGEHVCSSRSSGLTRVRSSRRKNASLECLPPIAPPRASLWDHEPRTFVFFRLVSIRDYTVQGYGRIDGARLDEHRDEFRRTHGRFISPRVSRSHEVARRPPPPSPRAPHPRARDASATRLASAATLATFGLGLAAADPLAAVPTGVAARTGGPRLPPPSPLPLAPPSPAPALPPAPPPSTVAVAFSARDDLDYVPLYGLDDRDDVAARDRLVRLGGPRRDGRVGGGAPRRQPRTRRCSPRRRSASSSATSARRSTDCCPTDFPVRPVRDARLLRGEPLLVAGIPRDTPAALLGRSLADPSPLNPLPPRGARGPPPARVPYAEQGLVGGFMQSLTWLFSTLTRTTPVSWTTGSGARPSRVRTVSETLRRCTYEPKGTWYRERRSRVNAPLDWPYCEDDLGLVYEYCTDAERQVGVCDPRVARNRGAFERSRRLEFLRQQASYARPGEIYR